MSQRLQVEHWVPVALPRVFAFFADPHNLPRIMPPSQGAKILKLNLVPPRIPDGLRPKGLERMAGAGTEIYFKFRAIPYIPIHERWTALITEFSYNEYFSDIQKQGPFKSWHHTHYFEAKQKVVAKALWLAMKWNMKSDLGPWECYWRRPFSSQ